MIVVTACVCPEWAVPVIKVTGFLGGANP